MGGDNSTSVQSRFSLTLVFPILYPRVGSGVVKNGNNWVPERFAENFDSKMQQDQNLILKNSFFHSFSSSKNDLVPEILQQEVRNWNRQATFMDLMGWVMFETSTYLKNQLS